MPKIHGFHWGLQPLKVEWYSCWLRNPANSPVEVASSLSHYLHEVFYTSFRWLALGFLVAINSYHLRLTAWFSPGIRPPTLRRRVSKPPCRYHLQMVPTSSGALSLSSNTSRLIRGGWVVEIPFIEAAAWRIHPNTLVSGEKNMVIP